MKIFTRTRAGFLGLSVLMISSCAETGSIGQKSFQSNYITARSALEQGDYDKANRAYRTLLPDAGELQPRIQLELSHSYLRAGDFAAASKQASRLAGSQKGKGRAAALSVQATADHEMGLQALAKGDAETGKSYLMQADAALTELLKSNPDLDPLGGMAGRKSNIKSRLESLR
ncbi:MAG: hypothetical protein WA790_18320 [Sulfitobacter sp.]